MVFHIRNMVCPRCISSVRRIVSSLGLTPVDVVLGECSIEEEGISREQMDALSAALMEDGFEILLGKDLQTVQQVKNIMIDIVYNDPDSIRGMKLSDLLQERMGQSYSAIRKTFVQVEGHTVERYLISIRIERAKELLKYDDMSLSQIADLLGYSSAAHLSAQFKQFTGITPREFKSDAAVRRKPIDSL